MAAVTARGTMTVPATGRSSRRVGVGGTRRGGPKACHGPQSCRAGTAETQPRNLALEVAGSSVPRTRRFAPRLASWSLDRKRAAPDRCHEGSWGDSELRERQPYGPTAPGASAPAGVGSRLTRAPAAASLRPGARPTLPKAGGVQGRPRRPPPNRGPARPWGECHACPSGRELKGTAGRRHLPWRRRRPRRKGRLGTPGKARADAWPGGLRFAASLP